MLVCRGVGQLTGPRGENADATGMSEDPARQLQIHEQAKIHPGAS